jgi:hypothetical protein
MMAYANIIPYNDPALQGFGTFPGNLALTFDVLTPITVVDLGVFNASGSGTITGSIQVAIYDTVSNTLVTPIVTFSGLFTPAGLGFDVFQAITPVVLGVGSYEVDAVGFSADDPNGNLAAGSTGPILNDDGGALAFTGAMFDGSSTLDDPTSSCDSCDPLPAQASQFDAGTFQIAGPTDTPEPGFFGVLAASLICVLFAARRYRTAS